MIVTRIGWLAALLTLGCGTDDAARGGSASDAGGRGGSAGSAPDSGQAGSGPADGAAGTDAASAGCRADLVGPALIEVPAPGGGAYCVDATEVTRSDYAAFLSDKGSDVSGQDPWCAWNTTYLPGAAWPPTGRETYPVVNVDWCDAFAYCKWAGKRLCGKIGGGSNVFADFDDATKSQWMNACSAGGTKAYPYGDTFRQGACTDVTAAASEAGPVKSDPRCEGGYPGIFDMSGNVWEFEDSCEGESGELDVCHHRGGAFTAAWDTAACAYDNVTGGIGRNTRTSAIGFRCCSG